jgi:hypothetical protein
VQRRQHDTGNGEWDRALFDDNQRGLEQPMRKQRVLEDGR